MQEVVKPAVPVKVEGKVANVEGKVEGKTKAEGTVKVDAAVKVEAAKEGGESEKTREEEIAEARAEKRVLPRRKGTT